MKEIKNKQLVRFRHVTEENIHFVK